MSNGSKSRKPKEKAQPRKALQGGEQPQQGAASGGAGAGREEELPDVVEIDLVKISPVVWSSAEVRNSVELVRQNGEFEVLSFGKRLGSVPPDYDDMLASRSSYRGKIKRRSENPLGVRIEVRL